MITKNIKISIIIVSWNVRQELLDCLRSIRENQPESEYQVIVVDNASNDGTVEAVQAEFPQVEIIINSENKGFAAANNVGLTKAHGEYILFLNPDTIVHKDSLDILLDFMDNNTDVGACGPKLLNSDGTIQPSTRHFPDFRSALYQNTIFRKTGIFRKNYRRYRMLNFGFDKRMDADIIMGAALLVRRSIINEIGNMDESFFMYYEEADLCYRIIKANWRIVFIPDASITHLGGKSSDQLPVRKRLMRLKSLCIFFEKHYGKYKTGIFNCIFIPAVLLRYLFDFFSGLFMYLITSVLFNKILRKKHAKKIKYSALFLGKYTWQLLYRC